MAKPQPEFIRYLVDELALLGPVMAKRMFGGWGIFCDGLMFCLVADDSLYIKADDHNRQRFESAGCEKFGYMKKDKRHYLSYYLCPADAFDDAEVLQDWAREGLAAALRNRR